MLHEASYYGKELVYKMVDVCKQHVNYGCVKEEGPCTVGARNNIGINSFSAFLIKEKT